MSVTFYPVRFDEGADRYEWIFNCDCLEKSADIEEPPFPDCEICRDIHINLANRNAWDLLSWLGIEPDYCGVIQARDLAARCRRRLWNEPRNHDEGIETIVSGRFIDCGREPGYLRRQTERLLFVAEKAGDHFVSWG